MGEAREAGAWAVALTTEEGSPQDPFSCSLYPVIVLEICP